MQAVTVRKPKVSVAIITYNQADYIRQCLQSILDQEVDFEFEIIIGDDCSTDDTREIVQAFINDHPTRVRMIVQETNTGGTKNMIDVHAAARGLYIAHMDGDDFMLPGKLQTQVEALDSNPDCAICAHAVKRFDQSNNAFLPFIPKAIPEKSDLAYLLMNLPFFAHSSKMYRSECNRRLEFRSNELLDCYFHVHHALSGKILYLIDILGVHRINLGLSVEAGSLSNSVYQNPNPDMVDYCIDAIEYAKHSGVADSLIKKSKAKIYFDFAYNYLMARDYNRFQHYIKKSNKTGRLNMTQLAFGYLSIAPGPLFLLVRLRAALRNGLTSSGMTCYV